MKKILLSIATLLALNSTSFAQTTAGQSQIGYLTTSGCPSGQTVCFVQYGSTVPVSGSLTPSGTQDVNVKQQNGTTNATGNGATTAGTQRVTISNDSTGTVAATQATASSLNAQVVGSAASGATDSGNPVKTGCVYNSSNPTVTNGQRVDCQAGSRGSMNVTLFSQDSNVAAAYNNTSTDTMSASSISAFIGTNSVGRLFNGTNLSRFYEIRGTDGTGLGVAAVAVAPNSSSASAITPVVSNAVSNLQGKTSAGNLYDAYLTNNSGATAYFYVFNSSTNPSTGAVTAGTSSGNYQECIVVPNGGTGSITYSDIPERFSTGIWLVASSAACGTNTAVSTGITIHARIQ